MNPMPILDTGSLMLVKQKQQKTEEDSAELLQKRDLPGSYSIGI